MKKIVKILAALSVVALLGSGCTDLLKKVGVTDDQLSKAEKTYEDVKVQVSEGIEQVKDHMNVMTDRLGELVLGSDQAYAAVTGLYANTRRATRYDDLDAKALDGMNLPESVGQTGHRLGKFTGLLGGTADWYSAGKNPYAEGSDTWYVYGRFGEDTGIKLGSMGEPSQWLNDTDTWVRQVYQQKKPGEDMNLYSSVDGYGAAKLFVSRGAEKIYPHAIAVCADTVLYIEDVRFVDGAPSRVYFSEADRKGLEGQLDDWDGILQVMDYDTFLQQRQVLGYIVPLNIFI